VNVLEQVGEELGVSSWIPVEQRRIDAFAALTGDYQWIHVDAERAAKGPFGTTIAHGYLMLALVASTLNEVVSNQLRAQAVLNYGIDRLRFINPVKAGSRVRNRVKLAGAESKGGGRTLITMACTLEIDGEDRPALAVSVLALAVGDGVTDA
jgi:acyl dehydratase